MARLPLERTRDIITDTMMGMDKSVSKDFKAHRTGEHAKVQQAVDTIRKRRLEIKRQAQELRNDVHSEETERSRADGQSKEEEEQLEDPGKNEKIKTRPSPGQAHVNATSKQGPSTRDGKTPGTMGSPGVGPTGDSGDDYWADSERTTFDDSHISSGVKGGGFIHGPQSRDGGSSHTEPIDAPDPVIHDRSSSTSSGEKRK